MKFFKCKYYGQILIVVILSMNLKATSQVNSEGVVISQNKDDKPDPSAILEVKTGTNSLNGVRLPQTTINTANNSIEAFIQMLETQRSSQPDGLIYYDPKTERIYYHNVESTTSQTWTALEVETSDNKMNLPDGSIIMYCGTINSENFTLDGAGIGEFEGWYICNGKNKTPNLLGRFLCGETRAMGTRLTGGFPNAKIEEKNIEPHIHVPSTVSVDFTHSHKDITFEKHVHGITSVKDGDESRNGSKTDRKADTGKRDEVDVSLTSEFGYESINYTTPMNQSALKVELSLPLEKEWMSDDDATKREYISNSFDNRPRYFVVVYLIKNVAGNDYRLRTAN